MNIDQKQIDELVAHPSESLNVEIKNWISADDKAGQAKIVCAVLALRNRNGGFLVIGFNDKTLLPQVENRPSDVKAAFHTDKIQGLISKYASELFEVGIAFGTRDGQDYPVIVIPPGVQSPVAAKADLKDDDKHLIRHGGVYFRTLGANGTPSTALAQPQDWPEIVKICSDNREADFGGFLRRQLAGRDVATLIAALKELGPSDMVLSAGPSLCDRSIALLDDGERRFKLALTSRKLNATEKAVTEAGSWTVALGRVLISADIGFLGQTGVQMLTASLSANAHGDLRAPFLL